MRDVRAFRDRLRRPVHDVDSTVPLSYDQRFDSLLTATSVDHALYTYPGEDHLQVRLDPTMLDRVHSWYTAHGLF